MKMFTLSKPVKICLDSEFPITSCHAQGCTVAPTLVRHGMSQQLET